MSEPQDPNDRPSRGPSPMAKAGVYMGLAFVLPGMMFVLWWLGEKADEKLGTNFLAIAGLMLGLAGGLWEIIRMSNQIERRGKK